MAGGVILLAVFFSIIETTYIIPLHGAIQAVSGMVRTVFLFHYIRWRIVLNFSLGILPGAILGIYAFRILPGDTIKLMMGIFILCVTYMPRLKKKSPGEGIFLVLGFVSGVAGVFFGAVGPFISPYFIRDDISKETLVGTKAFCQMVVHLVKIPLFGLIGANILDHRQVLITLCIASILGTIIGVKLLRWVPDRAFIIAFKALLTIIALRIIVVQLFKLLYILS